MSTCSPVATLRTLRRFNGWFDGFTPDSGRGRVPLSVNVSGYLRDESGWGAAARGYVRALRVLACPRASQTSPRSRRTVPAIGRSRRRRPFRLGRQPHVH